MPDDFNIEQQENPSKDDLAYVQKRFIQFNNEQSGEFPAKDLRLFAYDSEKNIIGGLFGDIEWGWLHINIIWVDDTYRHKGIGSSLMNHAENQAKTLGVHKSYIETTDFQAMGFYEKLGYVIFAELEDQPPGHVCYYMKKTNI